MRKILFTLLIILNSLFVIAACPEGMIGYWQFDDGSGNVSIDSYGNNNGTVYGDAVWNSSGRVGGALMFDGSGDYVVVPDSPSFDFDTATYEVWFLDNNVASQNVILFKNNFGSNDGDIQVQVFSGGKINSYVDNSAYQKQLLSDSGITQGEWYHVAIVANGTHALMYVNGVLQADIEEFSGFNTGNSVDFYIGKYAFGGGFDFQGIIDEVAVYNRDLTSSEILQHYQNGLNGIDYCGLSGEGVIPEVEKGSILQVFVILIVALLIGALLVRKK